MTDQELVHKAVARGELLLVPGTGEVVDPRDEQQVGQALRTLRGIQGEIKTAISALSHAALERSRVLGTKTIRTGDMTITVGPDSVKVYDAEAIEQALREAGAPEEMIAEVVVPTVTYKVDARRAQQAAKANPEYAAIIERYTTVEPRQPMVRVT